MSKYRIIKRTFADGTELFGVQKKCLLIWWNCYHEDAFVRNRNNRKIDRESGMFRELEFAREFIKDHEGSEWVSDRVVK